MRILSLFMAFFCCALHSSAQEEFMCDSVGVEAPLNFITTFTPNSIDVGSSVCIDFSVEHFDNVLGTTSTISFDPSQLLWVSSTQTVTGISGVSFNENSVSSGLLSFLWTDFNVQGVTLPDNTSFFEVCFVVVAEAGETIDLYFNDNLSPTFPESGVVYQISPIIACEDKYLELNGENLASIQVNCSELTVTNINACEAVASEGFISLEICGGSGPYSVDLTNNTTQATLTNMVAGDNIATEFTGLTSGNYTAIITDATGVSISQTITISSNGPISYDVEVVDPVCYYVSNGEITLSNFSGGSPPYTAAGSNGLFLSSQLESTFSGLSNGTYNVTISDDAGCSIIDSFEVFVAPFVFEVEVDPATCVITGDGYVSLTVSGGTPFTGNEYLINGEITNEIELNNPTSNSAFDPQTQILSFVIEDASGCRDGIEVFVPYIFSPGTPCDDGDPATFNDQYQADCTCMGTPAIDIQYLGNPIGFLPPDITVVIENCAEGFVFPNGAFEDFENNVTYPFPLEQDVHFIGQGVTTFISTSTPTDVFPEGMTTVTYTILDENNGFLTHSFTVNVECTGCSTITPRATECELSLTAEFFSCDVGSLLDGYTACTAANDGTVQEGQPLPLCNGDGVPNNMSWFSFVAGSNTLDITVTPGDCNPSPAGLVGVQFGVYDDCMGSCIGGDVLCEGLDPRTVSLNDLSVGKTYFLFIDGCGGASCMYQINIDNYEPGTLNDPEEIVFSSPIPSCQVLNNRFCSNCEINIDLNFNGNQSYGESLDASFVWTVTPPIDGFDNFVFNLADNGTVFPVLNNVEPGSYGICLFEIESECGSWSSILCSEMIVEDCATVDEDMDGVPATMDCNDQDPEVFPGNIEVCDGKDNNCDGVIDEGLVFTYFLDTDGDGFGSAANSTESCEPLNGFVENGDDCDDGNANVNPDASEICDGLDNDCDGEVDEGFDTVTEEIVLTCNSEDDFIEISWEQIPNADFYEVTTPDGSIIQLTDPSSFGISGLLPGTYEFSVQAFSNDGCSGNIASIECSTASIDNDGDGVVAGEDCDDNDPLVFPGAEELCDGKDNNCDGEIDEGLSFMLLYVDNDGDGYGDDDTEFSDCLLPPDVVTEGGDCDDTNPLINPGAEEIFSNGIDEDCDGIDNTVSVNELNGNQFIVYPNPTTGLLTVEGINFSKAIIIDRLGRVVESTNETLINISELSDGIYFIKLLDVSNEVIGLTKVIKR